MRPYADTYTLRKKRKRTMCPSGSMTVLPIFIVDAAFKEQSERLPELQRALSEHGTLAEPISCSQDELTQHSLHTDVLALQGFVNLSSGDLLFCRPEVPEESTQGYTLLFVVHLPLS
jgi:hypothetical protein